MRPILFSFLLIRRDRGIASSTLRLPLQSKLSNFKKWASKAFQKTFRDSSMNLNSKHSASSSSLPAFAPFAKQNHQQHRRTVSVRPLPAIPVTKVDAGVPRSETVPRNLHRRRATNGGRDLPVELKRADGKLNILSNRFIITLYVFSKNTRNEWTSLAKSNKTFKPTFKVSSTCLVFAQQQLDLMLRLRL